MMSLPREILSYGSLIRTCSDAIPSVIWEEAVWGRSNPAKNANAKTCLYIFFVQLHDIGNSSREAGDSGRLVVVKIKNIEQFGDGQQIDYALVGGQELEFSSDFP